MIFNILNSIVNKRKKINLVELPSQGYFYKDDFNIFIKKASKEDIENYKNNIDIDNISTIINVIKKVVKNNVTFSKDYIFDDIKSIDIIYIFLELVKFTKEKDLIISLSDNVKIEFDSKNFVYFFTSNDEVLKYYDSNNKCFNIEGYKFTLPSIGVENNLTRYLVSKIDVNNEKIYTKYFYDFTYFLGDRNFLSDHEIENLITIFNYELEEEEIPKIKKIVDMFIPMQKYKLKKDNKMYDLTSKVDLVNIWN